MFHYQAEFIPFIFVSAIYATRKVLAWRFNSARLLPVIALTVFPLAALISSDLPLRVKASFNLKSANAAAAKDRDAVLNLIPGSEPVAATFTFLPKLANRSKLYSLHHIYTGSYTLSTVPYKIPADIRYVVIDTMDPLTFKGGGFYGPKQYLNLQAILSNSTWKIASNLDTLLVLEKDPFADSRPLDLVRLVQPGTAMNTNILHNHPDSLELTGFDIQTSLPGKPAKLTLFWKKHKPDPVEYDIHLTILEEGLLYEGVLAPGSRIWPTQSWPDLTQTNAIIADRHDIHLSRPVTDPSRLQLRAAVVPVN